MKYKYVFYDNNLKTAPGVGALGAAGARRFFSVHSRPHFITNGGILKCWKMDT